MLDPLIPGPNQEITLNSLKRYTLSAVVVPRQDLAVVNVPVAPSTTQPGMSTPIPLQGPGDGKTEIYSFTADYPFTNGSVGPQNSGIGTISIANGSTLVTGLGTKFLTQLVAGDSLYALDINGVVVVMAVLSIQGDGNLTIDAAVGTDITASPFAYRLTVTSDTIDKVFVKITDQAWRRTLMNRDVPAIHVFGSQTKPLFSKESILLETDQSLLLNFYNYSTTSPASIAPICEGRKWQFEALKYPKVNQFIEDLRMRKKWVQPYWLTLDDGWINIPANSSKGAFFTCTGDITLALFNLYGRARDALFSTDKSDRVTVEFSDAKTTRAMQVQPVPLTCCAGTSQNPYRLPTPWIVEPQTQIKANFVNTSTENVRVSMTFHGVAIYTGSNFNGSTLTNANLVREAGRMYEAMSMPQVRPAAVEI